MAFPGEGTACAKAWEPRPHLRVLGEQHLSLGLGYRGEAAGMVWGQQDPEMPLSWSGE